MDPMEQAEEDRKRKELFEWRDMEDAVGIGMDLYFSSRDLSNKGKDVLPSGKQTKTVQQIAATLRVPDQSTSSRRKETEGDAFDSVRDFDLLSQPRIMVYMGNVNKKEPDGFLRRFSKRHIFIFSDVLLLTNKKENSDTYDLDQVMWFRDLKIRHFDGDSEEEKKGFELILNKPRNKGIQATHTIVCENESAKRAWVEEIENSLLAYHRDTMKLGWFHDFILGTYYSAAHIGDVVLLRKFLRSFELKGCSVDAPDNAGTTALHYAAMAGHETIVRLLLDNGADVDAIQGGGNTPLLLAAARGHDSVMRLLIDRGADIRMRNRRDRDAVFMAVVYGHSTKGLPWVLQVGMDT